MIQDGAAADKRVLILIYVPRVEFDVAQAQPGLPLCTTRQSKCFLLARQNQNN